VGLAIFGTNSEANSLSVREKSMLVDELVHTAKAPPHRLMPGTGTCSIHETVELTKHATSLGVGGVLMLPPFYYKVSRPRLLRSHAWSL
jgi:4-hydroxy-tetrahydrodipicolinate synthase